MEGKRFVFFNSLSDCKAYRITEDMRRALQNSGIVVKVSNNEESKGGKYRFFVEYQDVVVRENITLAELKKVALDTDVIKSEVRQKLYCKYESADEKGHYVTLSDYKSLVDCTQHIGVILNRVESEGLKLGVILNYVSETYGYKFNSTYRHCVGDYFADIYDYAQKKFGLSRGSCFNFMSVAKRFTDNKIDKNTGNVVIKEPFRQFGMSQLIQMLPYEDERLVQDIKDGTIDSSYSVRALKDKLKSLYAPQPVLDNSDKEDMEGQISMDDYTDEESFDCEVNAAEEPEMKSEKTDTEEFSEDSEDEIYFLKTFVIRSSEEFERKMNFMRGLLQFGYSLSFTCNSVCED